MRSDVLTEEFEIRMDKLLEEEEQQKGKLDDTLVRPGQVPDRGPGQRRRLAAAG